MKRFLISLATVAILLLSSVTSNAYAFEKKDFKNQTIKALEDEEFINETEPNDSFEQANSITLDELYGGIMSEGDKDYYKLTISQKGQFFVQGVINGATSTIQPVIYNANGEAISIDGDSYDEFFSSSALITEPGTYYIELTPNTSFASNQEYILFTMIYPGDVSRLSGSDRYETAVEIATSDWGYAADEIILTTGQDFPDALAAGPLAYQLDAPILLTTKNSLPPSVVKYLHRSDISKVTIIGGTGVVSTQVEDYLKNEFGVQVERIAGKDRFDTAAKISERLTNFFGEQTAYVVNGRNFPDALSIAPVAASQGAPILLTETNTIPTATATKLKMYTDTFVIGGKGAVSDTVLKQLQNPTRISGSDRYETSAKVADYFYDPSLGMNMAYVATGSNFADALTGSVSASYYSAPLLLTPTNSLHTSVKTFAEKNDILWFTILGGKSAVNDDVEIELLKLVK